MQRHQDDPFILIGINTDSDRDDYRKKRAEAGMTWYNSWQGGGGGPLCEEYRARAFPTMLVLDAQGIIRYRGHSGQEAEEVAEELLAEMK